MIERTAQFFFNPQVNISRSTATRMWLVSGSLLAAVIQSSLGDSFASLFIALAAVLSAVTAELLLTYSGFGFEKLKDGSAMVTALALALMLPNQIHPVYAALGAVFAIAVVKHSYGGLGSSWLNPAVGGWLFIRFSWSAAFDRALGGFSEVVPDTASSAGQTVGNALNGFVFRFFGAELPSGYIDLFSLSTPGIIADRAVLLLVFATIIITASQISRSWISFLYLGVFGLLIRLAGDLYCGGEWWNGDVIYAFCSGGTFLAAFILIAEPSSGPKSVPGNALMAVAAAALSMVFRSLGSVFYGCFFAVAVMNALTPLVCMLERYIFYTHTVKEGAV